MCVCVRVLGSVPGLRCEHARGVRGGGCEERGSVCECESAWPSESRCPGYQEGLRREGVWLLLCGRERVCERVSVCVCIHVPGLADGLWGENVRGLRRVCG